MSTEPETGTQLRRQTDDRECDASWDTERFYEEVLDEQRVDQVMNTVFNIGSHERRTYFALLDHPTSTTDELGAVLDRDRSNVNRSLTGLREKGLVTRRRRLLDGGGHVYQYMPRPLEDVQELLHGALDSWTADVHDRIDEFGKNSLEH